jgi:DnaJ family protein A protein 2
MSSDLYKELGVQKGASPEDIKRAYRKEALAKHPDRGGSKEDFQRLQAAYDVLSNPDRRAVYDQTGEVGEQAQGGHMPNMSELFSMFGPGLASAGLSSMFGSGFGSGFGPSAGRVKPARGPNKLHEIGLTLAEMYSGKRFTLNMKRDVLCAGCGGSGGSEIKKCEACRGQGVRMRMQQMGPIMAMSQEACDTCQQTGERVVTACSSCGGKRVREDEHRLEVVVEPGMKEGDRLVFPGQCSESPHFEAPGDVMLVIRASSTEVSSEFKRWADDLVVDVQLTLAESLLGFTRVFDTHPSGEPVTYENKKVVIEGDILKVEGAGMPVRGFSDKKGDLQIVCHIRREQGTWSDEQRRALASALTN